MLGECVESQGVEDVAEHGVVEIDAAESLESFGATDRVEPDRSPAQQCRVERATTEVVHRHDVADLDPLGGGVVHGCGLRFGQEADVGDPRQPRCLSQQVELVLAEAGRVGERHVRRRRAVHRSDTLDHDTEHVTDERLGAVRGVTEHDRRGVPEAALERDRRAFGLVDRSSFGRLADEHVTIGPNQHDGGDRRSAGAEGTDLHTSPGGDRRRRERGADVDAEAVLHRALRRSGSW